jgi:hypothetical protein
LSRLRPLPQSFLKGLERQEEVLVTSREGSHTGTVPVWFAVDSKGFLYLFGHAFSLKARRWRRDPWIRLCNPANADCVEGLVEFLSPDQSNSVADLVATRWPDWGVLHPEGLRQMLASGTHVLLKAGLG